MNSILVSFSAVVVTVGAAFGIGILVSYLTVLGLLHAMKPAREPKTSLKAAQLRRA